MREPPPEERAQDGDRTEAERAAAESGDAADVQAAVERILTEARSVGRDLLELFRLGLDRARLGARSRAFRLLALVWLGLAGATATIVATVLVVQGLASLATAAFGGQVWAGRLTVGALVLAATGLAILVLRGRSSRAALERLEARYAGRETPSDRGESA